MGLEAGSGGAKRAGCGAWQSLSRRLARGWSRAWLRKQSIEARGATVAARRWAAQRRRRRRARRQRQRTVQKR
jgi:hypothetical protein